MPSCGRSPVIDADEKSDTRIPLLHHVTPSLLVEGFHALRKQGAAGVDGVTWRDYGKHLDGRVHELHRDIQSGAYRAQPSRRVYIPKADPPDRNGKAQQCFVDAGQRDQRCAPYAEHEHAR